MQEKNETSNKSEEKPRSLWTIKGMLLLFLRNKVRMYRSLHNDLEKKLSQDYLHENLTRVLFLFIYLAVTIALFIFVIIYRISIDTHWLEVIARICGMQLNFNCMLMIVLMLRHTARIIRTSPILRTFIPVDDTISIHKMVGRWIVVLVVIHALFHMIYFGVEGTR